MKSPQHRACHWEHSTSHVYYLLSTFSVACTTLIILFDHHKHFVKQTCSLPSFYWRHSRSQAVKQTPIQQHHRKRGGDSIWILASPTAEPGVLQGSGQSLDSKGRSVSGSPPDLPQIPSSFFPAFIYLTHVLRSCWKQVSHPQGTHNL